MIPIYCLLFLVTPWVLATGGEKPDKAFRSVKSRVHERYRQLKGTGEIDDWPLSSTNELLLKLRQELSEIEKNSKSAGENQSPFREKEKTETEVNPKTKMDKKIRHDQNDDDTTKIKHHDIPYTEPKRKKETADERKDLYSEKAHREQKTKDGVPKSNEIEIVHINKHKNDGVDQEKHRDIPKSEPVHIKESEVNKVLPSFKEQKDEPEAVPGPRNLVLEYKRKHRKRHFIQHLFCGLFGQPSCT